MTMSEHTDNIVEIRMEDVEPLTDWENEPSVADLKKDFQEAESFHDVQVAKVKVWLDNLNVKGKARIKKVRGRSTIVPKLIRKQAEWRYAALSEPFLSIDNIYMTAPVSWEDKKAAIQNGLVLNNQFNTKINKVRFIDEYVRTAVDEGTVIVRVGWEFEEEEVMVPNMVLKPIQDPQLIQQVAQASQALQQDPQVAQQMPPELVEMVELSMKVNAPVQVVEDGEKPEIQTTVNQPTVEVCNYRTVTIDPTCKGDLSKANFVIYSFETSLSKLEKEGIYKNLDNINIESNSIANASDLEIETHSFNFQDKPRKKFVAYEYWGFWDIDGSGLIQAFVATWVGDTMIRMEENPFPDGKVPFVIVQYLPKRGAVYGEPDGELLEDNQKVSGAVTRGMIDIMGRSAAGQVGVRQDALDVTNRRKFEAGQDYSFNAHIDPRQAFFTHTYPEIPNSAQFMLQLQNMEAESLTGVKAFTSGITGDALGKQASSARSALDAAGKRELGILRRLSSGIVEIGRKIIAMNAEFLSDEEIVRVTNEEFITVKRDDLPGKLDIKLDISTAETDNAKAQELAFMLQTMGNNMPQEMSQIILSDIARLRKMPELSKRIGEYKPQPDPLEEERKKLELEKMKADIAKTLSEARENDAEAQWDIARTNESQSKADNLDLDFVEKESGIQHDRDLEKSSTQAKANTDLKVLDNVLKGGTDIAKEHIRAQSKNQPPNS